MPFLKQSTAQTIRFGPCLDITDGVTEETALTLAQADMRLSKDGGAFAQKSAAGNATHDSDGWYSTSLSTTDTGTVGELILNVHQPANMLPVWLRWWVLEESIYDSLFGAAAAGFDANQRVDVGEWLGTAVATPTVAGVPEVDPTHLGGDAQSLTDLKDFADAGYDPAANKVQGVVLVDTTTTNTDVRGTDNAALASVVGALADAAAAGDPTSADTLMQYVKQLVNLLAGTAGIATMPAGVDPANGVNLFEMLRAAMGSTFATATDSLEQLQADLVTLQGDTDDIQARLPAALVGGAMDSDVSAIQASAAQTIRDEIMPTQNVAFDNLEFLFVAASDHVTPVTAASGTAVTRSIDGGAFGSGTGTLAEVGNGIYQYDASAGDMNGGIITFRFTGTGGTPGVPDDVFVTIVTGGGV